MPFGDDFDYLLPLIDASYDAFIVMDQGGKVMHWNTQSEAMFGWSRDEAIGQRLSELIIPPSERPRFEARLKFFLESDEQKLANFRDELPTMTKTNELLTVDFSVSPFRRPDGFIFGAFLRNVSERKQAEQVQKMQFDITAALAEAVDSSSVIQNVLSIICAAMHWDFGAYWKYDAKTMTLSSSEIWATPALRSSDFWQDTMRITLEPGKGIPGECFAAQKPILLSTFTEKENYVRRNSAIQAQIATGLGVPVFVDESSMGVLEFYSCSPVKNASDFLPALSELTRRLALALRRLNVEHELKTLKVELEKKVAERTKDLRVITDALPIVVAHVGADERFQFVNATYEDWYDLPKDEVLGKTVREVVGDEIYFAIKPYMDETFKGNKVSFETFANYRKMGSRFIQVVYIPDVDEGGHVRGFFTTVNDLTQRKLDEDRVRVLAEIGSTLHETLEYKTALARLSQMLVPSLSDWCAVDIIEENELKRLSVQHLDKKKIRLAYELAERYPTPRETSTVWKSIESRKPYLITELTDDVLKSTVTSVEHFELIKQLGLRSAVVLPLIANDLVFGAITLVMAESGRHFSDKDLDFYEEIARRAAVAITNAKLYEEAQTANRLKDEFLATLSHELRTPLNAILGWSELLESEDDKETIAEGLAALKRNARAQNDLINDILDVSRIITGKVQLNFKKADLKQIISEALETVRRAAEAKHLLLTTSIPEEPLVIMVDPARMKQVMWNLLSNAVKFTPPGGSIDLTVKLKGADISISVKDSGEGIDPEFLPHVFERFRQQDSSKSRKHGGLGLGLSIVRHLVELHGGTVEVTSEGKNKGTCFEVSLPLVASSSVEPHDHTRHEREALTNFENIKSKEITLSGLRVLVVDDAPDVLTLVKRFLQKSGAIVDAVSSTALAFEALKNKDYDLLLSDIGMPQEDGISFIKRVRTQLKGKKANVPAIALSAFVRDEEKHEAFAAGFHSHLSKPISPSELLAGVALLAKASEPNGFHSL